MTVHFIGFKGEEFHSAVKVFGKPDFIHRRWDFRAKQEASDPTDTIVFARWDDTREPEFRSFNDSEAF